MHMQAYKTGTNRHETCWHAMPGLVCVEQDSSWLTHGSGGHVLYHLFKSTLALHNAVPGPVEEGHRDQSPALRHDTSLPSTRLPRGGVSVSGEVVRPICLDSNFLIYMPSPAVLSAHLATIF